MDCSEDHKLKVVANKLKGSAAAYWKYLKNKRVLDGKPLIAMWEKIKSKFIGKFLPPDYEQRLYVQLQNCKQGNRTVEEYIDEFIRLNLGNLLPDNENMQITRFRGGLKREIQDQMKMLNTFTLGQAFVWHERLKSQSEHLLYEPGDREEEGDNGHEIEVVDGIEEGEDDDFVGMVMHQPCES
ncbi:hypothetical protein ACOSQ3_021902 [Xanthoceras sorbifolium]